MDNNQVLNNVYVDIKPNAVFSSYETKTSIPTVSETINTSSLSNSQFGGSLDTNSQSSSSLAYSSSFRRPIPQQYSGNYVSFIAPQSSSASCYPSYSTFQSSFSSLQQPQSLTIFPSTTLFSPPLSPPMLAAPLSFPLYQPGVQYNQIPQFSTQAPLQYPPHQQIQSLTLPMSRPQVEGYSSIQHDYLPSDSSDSNIKLQNEDDILNEAIQTAVNENNSSFAVENSSQQSIIDSSSTSSSMTQQKTIFEETLSNIDNAQLESYLNTHFIRPDSVKKKMRWTAKMFQAFCERLNTSMFPLNGRVVSAFLHMLAHDCHYAITSLTNVIYPSLVHLQQDAGYESDPTESAIIRGKLKSLQLDPRVKKEGKGKEPLCWFDVLELINRIPDSLGSKDMEASLFLFALQTGSRACTCGGVTWGDIMNYEYDESSGASRIIILQRITKGNQQWNHKVKLEGFIDSANNGDFLYFLEGSG